MSLQTLFAQVLNMSLTASAVIIAVLAIRLFLKNAPKKFSYALWAVVLFRLLCPVSLPAPVSVFHLLEAPSVSSGKLITAVEYLPTDVLTAEPTFSAASDTADHDTTAVQSPSTAPTVNHSAVHTPAKPALSPMRFAAMLWVLCGMLMLMFGGATYLRYRKNLVGALCLKDNIYLADHIVTPFVAGLIRPRIYLPSEISETERPYILAHEQYHIQRLDHIVKLVAYIALCIHWFNPLVWVAFVLSSKDMEMSCDEAVLSKLGGHIRADYAQSLLNLALGERIYAAAPLAFGENDTKGRVLNMAKWKKPTRTVTALCAALCLTVLVACGLNPAADTDSPQTKANALVGKWVIEDGGILVNHGIVYDVYYTFRADGTGEVFNDLPDERQTEADVMPFSYTPTSDGSFTLSMDGHDTQFTYTLDGDTLLLDSARHGKMTLTRVPPENNSFHTDAPVERFLSADGNVQFRWHVTISEEIAETPILTASLHKLTAADMRKLSKAVFSDHARYWQAPYGMRFFDLENDLSKAVPANWNYSVTYRDSIEQSEDLNMLVSDNDINYRLMAANGTKDYGAIATEKKVYGNIWRNSSVLIYSDDDSLTSTAVPTTQQVQNALDTSADMLNELHMGNWEIVNYFVRSTKQLGGDSAPTEYTIGVIAAPVYNGTAATLDILSQQPEDTNSHATTMYLVFNCDGKLQNLWFYNPMDITGQITDRQLLTTQQVMEIAKEYLKNEGYYKFKHLPDTDGMVYADITAAEICYRREYGSNAGKPFDYEYVPYILFYGNSGDIGRNPGADYTNIYPNSNSTGVPLFAVNALDGSIVQPGYNMIVS